MESEIRRVVTAHQLIIPGDHVMAAVSGGADSVALLIVLRQLQSLLQFDLSVCHLNHAIRGSAGDEDAGFVQRLCDQLRVPCRVEKRDVPAIRAKTGGSLEEAARRVRYDFFAEAAEHAGANKLALAHHRDDQCETILFNLLRGSSFHGLRGMPVMRPLRTGSPIRIIRPLLEVAKADLEDYLRAHGQDWRLDHTNELPLASRNIIRQKLLPVLTEIHPSFREHVLDIGHQAREIEAVLQEQAGRIMAAARKGTDDIRIEQWRLRSLPEIVATEVVRAMLLSLGAGLGQITARHLRQAVHLTNRMELPGGRLARVEYGWFIIGPNSGPDRKEEALFLPLDGECRFGSWTLQTEMRNFDDAAFPEFLRTKTRFQEWIDADKVQGKLTIRYAREGERFRPLGAPGSKKVGDFLTDVKAGWSARPAVVVADDKGIVWLVGWRIDERVRIHPSSSKVLQIQIRNKT